MIENHTTPVNPITCASQSIRPILPHVSVAFTSTILAVFGSEINGVVKRLIRRQTFIIRVSAFVALVTFGYGALNLVIAHLVSQMLMGADDLWLFPIVALVFIGIGVLAESRRQI
jgi:Protein of unknown function (DUF3392)